MVTSFSPAPARLGRFAALALPVQVAWCGALSSGIVLATVWAALAPPAPLLAAVAATGAVVTLAAFLLVRRACAGVVQLANTAPRLFRRDAQSDENFPGLALSNELNQLSARLRVMVDAARTQLRELAQLNAALAVRLEARGKQLNSLQDLSVGLSQKSELHELVGEALGALEQTLDFTSASLWARERGVARGQVALLGARVRQGNEGIELRELAGMRLSRANLRRYEQIERERQPLIENRVQQGLLSWLWSKVTDDAPSSSLYRDSRSWMAVPLAFREHVLGVMRVDHQEPEHFDAERARLLTAVGNQTALAMRHAELQAREREVAVVAERNRIARELHDAVSQTLFAANVIAGTLARNVMRDPPPGPDVIESQAQALEKLNRGALAEMRLLMFELRPDALLDVPLTELMQLAIEALRCQGKVTVVAELARDIAVPPQTRIHLYRIVQEALSNIARHSGADRAEVQWRLGEDGRPVLGIRDFGKGFDPQAPVPGHFGVESIRTRAAEIGATLEIASVIGEGTEIRVELPAEYHAN